VSPRKPFVIVVLLAKGKYNQLIGSGRNIGQSSTRDLINIRVKGGHFLFRLGADSGECSASAPWLLWSEFCVVDCAMCFAYFVSMLDSHFVILHVFLFLCICPVSAFGYCFWKHVVFWINCFYVTFFIGQVFELIQICIRWRWRATHELDEHDDCPLRQRLFFIINMCTWFKLFFMFSKNP